ncbi:MAG: hypothetical protein HFH63_02640 [Lachnospiraceae bacterium]|nr:hypothetical protein [Lachnospiraceae bacterium]
MKQECRQELWTQTGVNETGILKIEVILNRPFVYAVIDNRTKLPVYKVNYSFKFEFLVI